MQLQMLVVISITVLICHVFVLCVVDANNAGSGELSIVVNNGSVPSSARTVAQNIYAVSFLPEEPGIYTVELFFNCVPLKGLVHSLTAPSVQPAIHY